MTSSQPYLIRAIYEWIVDNGMTPHVLVATNNTDVQVPRQYEEDGRIVLNIGPTAVKSLQLGNEQVSFDARFGGKPMEVIAPIKHVMAVYARENGRGMMFANDDDSPTPDPSTETKPARPNLRVVK